MHFVDSASEMFLGEYCLFAEQPFSRGRECKCTATYRQNLEQGKNASGNDH